MRILTTVSAEQERGQMDGAVIQHSLVAEAGEFLFV